MEIRIEIKTPGNYLSTQTMSWVISDFVKVIYGGIYHGILETYPTLSKSKLKKRLRDKHLLYFTNIKRGSWELALLGPLGAIILKILYDLGIDIVKNNSTYEEVKDKINGTVGDNVANKIKEGVQRRDNYGSLIAEKKNIDIDIKPGGNATIKIETVLIRRQGATSDFSGEDDIEISKVVEHLLTLLSNKKKTDKGGNAAKNAT